MRRIASLATLLALVGCGESERVAGGGGIEIPNGIEVAVHDTLGRPVLGARVLLVAEATWASRLAAGDSPVLDSATTDAQGKARFPAHADPFWLEVETSDGTGARLSSRTGQVLQAVVQPTATLSGKIPTGEPRASRMRLAGTSLSTGIDSLGRFVFERVIQGRYALVAEGVPGRAGRFPAGSAAVGRLGAEQIEVHLDTSALLLDDFSDGDVDWILGDVFGASYWWMNAAVPQDSLVAVFGISSAIQAVHTVAGQRTFGVTASKASSDFAWANFGLDMGTPDRLLPRIDAMEAVRFRARGTGSWAILLATDSSGHEETWRFDLVPDTAWSTVRIPASSFRSTAGAALPVRARLRHLVFQTQQEGSLEIDDVALEGIGLEDWER